MFEPIDFCAYPGVTILKVLTTIVMVPGALYMLGFVVAMWWPCR